MKNSEKAVKLFCDGYNCAQAVFGAFANDMGFDEGLALKIAAPFGGGFGRRREVCGAVSGMLMAFGYIYGYDTPETGEVKIEHYRQTNYLCDKFKEQNNSIICREILKTDETGGTPEKRTEQYYKERPCVKCVRTASEILESYIKKSE